MLILRLKDYAFWPFILDVKNSLLERQTELSSVQERADEMLRKREKLSENFSQMENQNRELAERKIIILVC